MPSPFPGMNPYLERKDLWPEVHHWLVTLLAGTLVAQLRPKYRVAIEHRVYEMVDGEVLLVGIPDVTVAQGSLLPQTTAPAAPTLTLPQPQSVAVPMPQEVREAYLEVRDVATGLVVTTIELLSPKNKQAGEGRIAYESKRLKVLGSHANLVEVDLLRAGKAMETRPAGRSPSHLFESAYQILVSRANDRPRADLYQFSLQDTIPQYVLPLRQGDTEPIVDLQALLHRVYDEAGLDLAIDYRQAPPPPQLSMEEMKWMEPYRAIALAGLS